MKLEDLKPSPTEMNREALLKLVTELQESRLVSKKSPKKRAPAKPGKLHVLKHGQLGLGIETESGPTPALEIAWCGKSRELGKRKSRIKNVSKITKKDAPDLCKACVKALLKEGSLPSILSLEE